MAWIVQAGASVIRELPNGRVERPSDEDQRLALQTRPTGQAGYVGERATQHKLI